MRYNFNGAFPALLYLSFCVFMCVWELKFVTASETLNSTLQSIWERIWRGENVFNLFRKTSFDCSKERNLCWWLWHNWQSLRFNDDDRKYWIMRKVLRVFLLLPLRCRVFLLLSSCFIETLQRWYFSCMRLSEIACRKVTVECGNKILLQQDLHSHT